MEDKLPLAPGVDLGVETITVKPRNDRPVYKTLEEMEKALLETPEAFGAKKAPDANCNKCYGRGYVGHVAGTKQYLLCKCMFKEPKPKIEVFQSVPK